MGDDASAKDRRWNRVLAFLQTGSGIATMIATLCGLGGGGYAVANALSHGPSTTTTATPTTIPPTPTTPTTSATSGSTQLTGDWEGQTSALTLAVTQVDNDNGTLTLHANVTNGSSDSITLPVYGYLVASDNLGTTYQGDPEASNWGTQGTLNVPSNSTESGTIQLSPLAPAGATSLKVTFTSIFGSLQYVGASLSVSGVPVPH